MAWRLAALLGMCCVLGVSDIVRAGDELAPPVRLMADGKVIDTGPNKGHSGPCVEDIDGDGLWDLVLGDFRGKFRVYKNVGVEGRPEFKDTGLIMADGAPASVRIYCCVGSQARFADIDGDGHRDLIANSYDPGHCYLFRGLGDHKFAASQELVDKSGTPVRSAPKLMQDYQAFGSFFTPVDWDADGDFDLLIGCFDGRLLLRLNEGDSKRHAFAEDNVVVEAAEAPLAVEAHCCPVVADWDGDTVWDLVVGAEDGSVRWFRNVGKLGAPKFEQGRTLVEAPEPNWYSIRWNDADVRPGTRVQVEVVDFNNDGKLDLLVGDFSSAYHPRLDLSPEEREKLTSLIDEQRRISEPLAKMINDLRESFKERYPGDAVFSDEADKAWTEEYKAIRESEVSKRRDTFNETIVDRMRPLLGQVEGDGSQYHQLSVVHGYVWLYLRK